MTIYYHPDYVAAAHVFPTTRKSAWLREDLVASPLPGISWSEPETVTMEQLMVVHAPDYIEAVRTGRPEVLAESNGFPWDSGIWKSAVRSTGGVVAAALEAWRTSTNTGSLSCGLHHARRARGAGFCTFNGLALAASSVLADGAKRVLILDLDAHGGGGTNNIISGDPRIVHLDVTTNLFDRYSSVAPSAYNYVGTAENYLPAVSRRLRAVLVHGPFDLCIYNAGVDCHEDDPCGGLAGITTDLLREREEMVFRWGCENGIAVSFVLAGGYPGEGHSESTVVALHRQTVQAALKFG